MTAPLGSVINQEPALEQNAALELEQFSLEQNQMLELVQAFEPEQMIEQEKNESMQFTMVNTYPGIRSQEI